eukprot:3104540-Rhodomonas_salina.1
MLQQSHATRTPLHSGTRPNAHKRQAPASAYPPVDTPPPSNANAQHNTSQNPPEKLPDNASHDTTKRPNDSYSAEQL